MIHELSMIPAFIAFFVLVLAVPAILVIVFVRFYGRHQADKRFEKNLPSILAEEPPDRKGQFQQ